LHIRPISGEKLSVGLQVPLDPPSTRGRVVGVHPRYVKIIVMFRGKFLLAIKNLSTVIMVALKATGLNWKNKNNLEKIYNNLNYFFKHASTNP